MWFLLSGLEDNVYMEGFLNFVNCDKVVIVELLVVMKILIIYY